VAVDARRREAVAAAVTTTVRTPPTTGGAVCVRAQAGTVAALARGGGSTVVFVATSPGNAPSQGRRRRCSPASTMRQRSCRAGCVVVSWFRGRLLEYTTPRCVPGVRRVCHPCVRVSLLAC
jgi:hypothetical protein